MAGLTEKGIEIKRLPEVVTDLKGRARTIFQDLLEDPNDVVDTSDDSTIGRLIGLVSPSITDLWEASLDVYSAFDPNASMGIALDNLVALGGITRLEASRSVVTLLMSGDTGIMIPSGSVVSSPTSGDMFTISQPVGLTPDNASGVIVAVTEVLDNTLYSISYVGPTFTQSVTINSGNGATALSVLTDLSDLITVAHPTLAATLVGETLSVNRVDPFQRVTFTVSPQLGITKVRKLGEAIAERVGPIEQAANTVTNISTPVMGWDSVTNPVAAVEGRLQETDAELRLRFRDSKFQRATNTLDAIYTAIRGVTGVSQLQIYENDTDTTDENGLPPHSFLPVVVGGSAIDIGRAIWRNKPIGILSAGNTAVSVEDIQGFTHTVRFERPNPVVVYINIVLTTNDSFPPNGEDLIRNRVVEYFSDRFGVGDDVIYSRLFTPINEVMGHQVDSMTIGTSPESLSSSNIPVAFNEIAVISDVNISITIN